LNDLGHTLWIDILRLTADDDWRACLHAAIERTPAILVCGSSEWIYDTTFATTELDLLVTMIAESASRTPILPIRLDRRWGLTSGLRAIDWLDVSVTAQSEIAALSAAIDAALNGSEPPIRTAAPILDVLAAYVKRSSPDAARLRVFLRQHWHESFAYTDRDKLTDLIALWEPVADNPFFHVGHEYWADDVEARCAVHSVKCLLFQAHVQLGASDFEHHVPLAYAALREIVTAEPQVETDGLDAHTANIQNLNYRDTLAFAAAWYSRWAGLALGAVGVADAEIETLERQIEARREQLDRIVVD
jgi:TIR domain-containing protein